MITEERFREIMTNDEYRDDGGEIFKPEWTGDNAIQGLWIIGKYFDPMKSSIIKGANHDIIYSVNVDDIVEKGITEEDTIALRKLNWMIEDDSYLACFV